MALGASRLHPAVIPITLNLCSSVSIILVNKWLFTAFRFKFPSLIVAIDQVAVSIFCFIAQKCGAFEAVSIDSRTIFFMAFTSTMSNVGANISLHLNSVGTYQVAKLTTVPMTCVIEYLWFGTQYSYQILATLAILLVSIGIATITDVQLSVAGLMFGLTGALGTTLYSIIVKDLQRETKITGIQIVLKISGWIALCEAPFVAILDDVGDLSRYPFTPIVLLLVLVTCILALALNVSYISVVDATSPLTLQVLGHVKTILIVALGILLFSSKVVLKNLIGIGLALCAVIVYSYYKLNPPQPRREPSDADFDHLDEVPVTPVSIAEPSQRQPFNAELTEK
eukprot:NODE_3623_length_1187_cov_236.701128_g3441_i0.p1 GENE.NODE_3623_length_1187_cov_236.701128_g3441_i0~~NODE_3623_length_1187_cov_236.701128_g3441_i0.p1  ORF type:complete len:363 (-),score=30.32 NODE_3623_length_1187_cov_236.701128_g3441_i0:98-1114(-)